MAVLQEQRYQEIAQWVSAPSKKSLHEQWKFRLRDAGFDVQELQRFGGAFTHDAYILAYRISTGDINANEANAFLSQKYPDLKYGGGNFGDVRGGAAAEKAIEASSKPTSDPERKTIAQSARDDQYKAGIGSFQSNPSFTQPVQHSIRAPKVPELYDHRQIGEALRGLADQTSLALTSIANGAVRFQPNTLPGYVIQPGSLEAEKLDPVSIARQYRDLPGPDDAILLRLAPDYSTDRFFSFAIAGGAGSVDNSRKGPGRVWRVVNAQYPQSFAPTPGPQRYRLIFKDLRFGVMSLLQDSPYASGAVKVRYGMVIRDIPHYLQRIPSSILYTGFVGDSPTGNVGDNISAALGGGNVTKLFHGTATTAGRAYSQYVTNAALAYTPYGSGTLLPTAAELAAVEGVNFMLVTGRSADEVYTQMNSAPSANYARILGDARGPTASSPPGTFMDSPFPANLTRRTGGGIHLSQLETDSMLTIGQSLPWYEGVPMDYDSCQRLRATPDFFSVVVQPAFAKTIAYATIAAGTVESVALWDTLGIRTDETNNRELSVDIVIV